jgi:hypothetical protein
VCARNHSITIAWSLRQSWMCPHRGLLGCATTLYRRTSRTLWDGQWSLVPGRTGSNAQ